MATIYEGKPCVHGHVGRRYLKTNQCVDCNNSRLQKWRQANPDKVKALHSKDTNRNRRCSEWKKRNKDKVNARNAARRAVRQDASPPWLSVEDKKGIEGFYTMARRLTECTGIAHHVDHIHPLNGDGIRGLHVPWNLQVVPACFNLQKGNRV